MEENNYKDIIKEQILIVSTKRKEDKDREDYWAYIIGQLVDDLADYEGRKRWNKEPYDKAWEKYKMIRPMNINDIIKHFFDDDFFRMRYNG